MYQVLWSEEIVRKEDGWEMLQGFPEKGSNEKLRARDLKRGKMQREKLLVCTTNLALGSKEPVPFTRVCMFTKRLGVSITSTLINQ